MQTAQREPERRMRTQAAAAELREGLTRCGVRPVGYGHVVPWVLGDPARAMAVSHQLAQRGFDVRAIRPPTVPRGTARLRLTVSASHAPADIERLLSTMRSVLTELPADASVPAPLAQGAERR
jgi:7-keto-8-aminopelargonate synthetase-like enzyme